ncbi:hypothetical protein [Deinococcus alpinitundrae]|uniref:hypothetical protein n=1 Tax=Deinococcus alpinitundrae TaxID=468913 RepID=UPI00137A1907|nr:hypothetical protein [Deinococcus alpinitundrae]
MCQTIPGNQLDAVLQAALLEALSPARVDSVLRLSQDADHQLKQQRRLSAKRLADAQAMVSQAEAMVRVAVTHDAQSISAQRLMRELVIAEVELETVKGQLAAMHENEPSLSQDDVILISELSQNIGLLWEHSAMTIPQKNKSFESSLSK